MNKARHHRESCGIASHPGHNSRRPAGRAKTVRTLARRLLRRNESAVRIEAKPDTSLWKKLRRFVRGVN